MVLLIPRQFLCFAFLRNPSSIAQGKSCCLKILSHIIHSYLSFKVDALSAAICNSQSLTELKTAENTVLETVQESLSWQCHLDI